MKKVSFLIAILAVIGTVVSSQSWAGKLGDTAPALNVSEFVKGNAVDVTDGGTYVVEFWATWCPPCRTSIPHLTELQEKFKDKNVTFVGVSQEGLNTVKPFVKEMGESMDYTVAVDQNGQTTSAYLAPFGVRGIPHAFVVKDGKLAWHGHPMDGLAEELESITAN